MITAPIRLAAPMVLLCAAGLLLAGCGSGDDSASTGTDAAAGTPDIALAPDSAGTVVIGGQTHQVTAVHCNEMGGWRVVAEFDGGDATFDEGGGAAVDLAGARAWTQSSGDDVTPITVDGDGARGQTTVYSAEDTEELVVLEADVRC